MKGNMRREDGTYTGNLEQTYDELVRTYFPVDVPELDEQEHIELRREYEEEREEEGDEYTVTMSELKGLIGGMSVGKAPGEDGTPNECLKYVLGGVGESWREIVEGCMREGVFPQIWKRAEVVWIPKKGGSMRPISLLPAVGKVLDRLLASRISYSMERMGQFNERQYGFRRGRDCTMAIKELTEVVRGNKMGGRHSLVVALDLRNAFGSTWSPALVRNLRMKGISEKLVKMVKSFMRQRKVCVEGREWDSDVGCPQGSSLGPVLWLLMMEGWFERMEAVRQRSACSSLR